MDSLIHGFFYGTMCQITHLLVLVHWLVDYIVDSRIHSSIISLASQAPFAHSLVHLTTSTLNAFASQTHFLYAIDFR